MDPPHMVKKIPPAGKSISWNRPIASFEEAKMGIISVAMESVSFPFVTEKTSVGRELQLGIQTGRYFAAIWFQMRVQVFAVQVSTSLMDFGERPLTDRRIFEWLENGCKVIPHWQMGNNISHRSGLARHSKGDPGDFSVQCPWISVSWSP